VDISNEKKILYALVYYYRNTLMCYLDYGGIGHFESDAPS